MKGDISGSGAAYFASVGTLLAAKHFGNETWTVSFIAGGVMWLIIVVAASFERARIHRNTLDEIRNGKLFPDD